MKWYHNSCVGLEHAESLKHLKWVCKVWVYERQRKAKNIHNTSHRVTIRFSSRSLSSCEELVLNNDIDALRQEAMCCLHMSNLLALFELTQVEEESIYTLIILTFFRMKTAHNTFSRAYILWSCNIRWHFSCHCEAFQLLPIKYALIISHFPFVYMLNLGCSTCASLNGSKTSTTSKVLHLPEETSRQSYSCNKIFSIFISLDVWFESFLAIFWPSVSNDNNNVMCVKYACNA